jgi:catechol 2,3-dioxygenase-like lactoylglutathione lyase family enzyme
MRIVIAFIAVAASMSLAPTAARAQLYASGPVTNGHHHLNASDLDAHMRFWVDTLGGKAGTFATGTPIVMFPNALIFMRDQTPTGGSIGTTVDHVGFSVPNLRATVDRLVAAGYEMITAEGSPPGSEIVANIRAVPGNGPVSGIAYVLGPDDIKVEILEMRAQEMPIVSHHIHFFGDEAEQMRAWYVDVFGAAAQQGGANGFVVATLPGLSMNFTPTETATAATTGRVIDHIGFEVEDLKTFIAGIEAKGITLTVPYREIPAASVAIAFITDPWGTSIELTQGLDGIR